MINSSILNLKLFKLSCICAFFMAAMVLPNFAFAQKDNAKKDFDPTPLIMEHVSDSHSWPVAIPLVSEKFIPLPVILYTDKGMEFFSSTNLLPEGTIYKGKNYNYKLEGNHIKAVDGTGKVDETASVLDFSITRDVVSMFMTISLLLIVFLSVSSAYKKRVGKAPKGLQSFMEPLILFVRDDIALPRLPNGFYILTIKNPVGDVSFFKISINN